MAMMVYLLGEFFTQDTPVFIRQLCFGKGVETFQEQFTRSVGEIAEVFDNDEPA